MTEQIKQRRIALEPSDLKNIDGAMLDHVSGLNISTETNKGWTKVPVFWAGSERSHQIKDDSTLRDRNGVLRLPLITVQRTQNAKKLNYKGSIYAGLKEVGDKGGVIEWRREIKQDRTNAFAKANSVKQTKGKINFKTSKPNNKVIYESTFIPIPVYLDMMYKITIRSEYQTQMNDILSVFMTETGGLNDFVMARNGWRYEAFYEEDYSPDNNSSNFDDKERVFKSEINIRVLGYLIGAGKNQIKPFKAKYENAVDIQLSEFIETESSNKALPSDFNPIDLTGNIGWWEATSLSSQVSGSLVENWVDRKNRTLTQPSTGLQPSLTIDNSGELGVRFEGAQKLVYSEYQTFSDLNDKDFCVVIGATDLNKEATNFWWSVGNSGSTDNYIGLQSFPTTPGDAGTNVVRFAGRDSVSTLVLSNNYSNPYSESLIIINFKNSVYDVWVDKNYVESGETFGAGSFDFNQLTLGALSRTTDAFFLSGYVRLFGLFNKSLSTYDIRRIIEYCTVNKNIDS